MKFKTTPSAGGAAIADRLKLDPVKPSAGAPTTGKTSASVAFYFGVAALFVVAILAFTLYKHWEFLRFA